MPVSISTVKSPEASEAEGGRPLRSWMALRLVRSLVVEQCQPVADAESVSACLPTCLRWPDVAIGD